MIDWKYYPVNVRIPDSLLEIVKVFEKHESQISSNEHTFESNVVLSRITTSRGFEPRFPLQDCQTTLEYLRWFLD